MSRRSGTRSQQRRDRERMLAALPWFDNPLDDPRPRRDGDLFDEYDDDEYVELDEEELWWDEHDDDEIDRSARRRDPGM